SVCLAPGTWPALPPRFQASQRLIDAGVAGATFCSGLRITLEFRMNVPPEVVEFLQQLFFQQNGQAGQHADAVSALGSLLRHCLSGFTLTFLGCACLAFAVVLLYRPRLTRGALWVPGFGLFGGTPTLYLHTRPASVCGLFASARRT